MTRTEKFILDNRFDLSPAEMSHKLHISKAKIIEVLERYGAEAKEDIKPQRLASRREKKSSVCDERPEACFECPYRDCTCAENMTEKEIEYRFSGTKSDSEAAVYQRGLRGKKK